MTAFIVIVGGAAAVTPEMLARVHEQIGTTDVRIYTPEEALALTYLTTEQREHILGMMPRKLELPEIDAMPMAQYASTVLKDRSNFDKQQDRLRKRNQWKRHR